MHVARYEEKTGERVIWNLPFVECNGSWFNYKEEGENLVIVQASGNYDLLLFMIRGKAKALHSQRILFATERNGKAFAKLIGGKVVGSIVEIPLCQE